MRYAITTHDEQGLIGIQLSKWEKEGKLQILEKSETLLEIQANLQRIANAIEILKKAGYNGEIMQIFLQKKSGVSAKEIRKVLYAQNEFLRQIGAMKK